MILKFAKLSTAAVVWPKVYRSNGNGAGGPTNLTALCYFLHPFFPFLSRIPFENVSPVLACENVHYSGVE